MHYGSAPKGAGKVKRRENVFTKTMIEKLVNHKITKDSKRGRNEGTTKTENDKENRNSKFLPINNYFKCMWIKFSNQNM